MNSLLLQRFRNNVKNATPVTGETLMRTTKAVVKINLQSSEQPNEQNRILRSTESSERIFSSTELEKSKETKQMKKPRSRKEMTIKSSQTLPTPQKLTMSNLSKINYVIPMHKHMRIKQWVNSIDDNMYYPCPNYFNSL